MRFPEDNGTNIVQREAAAMPRRSLLNWLIGNPLQTADAPSQTIGKRIGLAVFASDVLSSTAYATQEIFFVLALAGMAAFQYAFPISIGIIALLAIVTVSYVQTVHAYQGGGGAYIVARDNLGELSGKMAGAALLNDYILTVAVSISAGVAQIVSAFPELFEFRIILAIALILFIMLVNLRGVRESGILFGIPTYFFIFSMLVTVGVGIFRSVTGTLGTVPEPPNMDIVAPLAVLTPFLILHAFASGTAALTGIEAISNGVTAFKEPRGRNASLTLIWMALILAVLFIGITHLAIRIQAVPSEAETVISQLARTVYPGQEVFYLGVIAATTIILVMATNTAFAGFPRLSAVLASDGWLPRQLAYRGSRLVYSRGIVTLALIASLLVVLFQASVNNLIPLYAVGVFLSFTLSQAGMARRWLKCGRLKPGEEVQERGSVLRYDPLWQVKLIISSFGAMVTAIVMMVFAITKFWEGAWLVLVLIPLIVVLFSGIQNHYRLLAQRLSLEDYGVPPQIARQRVILLISGVHRGSLAALRYARALSDDVTAVHVSINAVEAERVREKWDMWGEGVRLVILHSPYRLLIEPLLGYIEDIARRRQPNDIITVVVPQFVARRWYHNLLHTQTAFILRLVLMLKPGIVITDVPYQVE